MNKPPGWGLTREDVTEIQSTLEDCQAKLREAMKRFEPEPEPFDESKVRHGSVWKVELGRVNVLVHIRSSCDSIPRFVFLRVGAGDFQYVNDRIGVLSLPEAVAKCREMTYLGQYNFESGLPGADDYRKNERRRLRRAMFACLNMTSADEIKKTLAAAMMPTRP